MKWTTLLPLLVGFVLTASANEPANVTPDTFRSPPMQARPMVYWDWICGNINREAITRDLEHMKKVGLGGGLLFDVPPARSGTGFPACPPPGPVDFMSGEWLDLVNFAAEESHRLGLDFGVVLCGAWNTGGPWIKPKDNNQLVASSLTRVSGPKTGPVPLAAPSTDPDYHDVAVVAWPASERESRLMSDRPPVLTINGKPGEAKAIIDGDKETGAALPFPDKSSPTVIGLDFPEPVTVDRLYIQNNPRQGITAGWLEADVDGAVKRLAEIRNPDFPEVAIDFPAVTAKSFRVVATGSTPWAKKQNAIRVIEVALVEPGRWSPSEPAIRNWSLKKAAVPILRELPGKHQDPTPDGERTPAIDPQSIVNLTGKLGPDGKLSWDVPGGSWTILRLGMVPAHSMIYYANGRKGNEGALEADKMSADAIQLHYRTMAGAIFDHLSPEGRKGLGFFEVDSWEDEINLWTKGFLEEFKKLRGYDLVPYLPVFDGKIVGDGTTSDRVLWDYRRTIGDLHIKNHFKKLDDLCHEDGVKLCAESSMGELANMDAIGSLAQVDYPAGEFWNPGRGYKKNTFDVCNSVKDASSVVNIYGKPYGLFESFTSLRYEDFWPSPLDLKGLGDYAMGEGVSRMLIHGMWMDPVVGNRPPGNNWFAGIHVGPSITWMPDGRAFFDYLARCGYLLQSGSADKDVLYFYGDGMPNLTPRRDELPFNLPDGRDYDTTDGHAVRELISVKDGLLTLPCGSTYRTLVLPPLDTMLPETLEAVSRLVKAGATVVGPKPLRSPSLSEHPEADQKIKRLADELWGKNPGPSGSRKTGKGTVFWGSKLEDVFTAQHIPPQIETFPAEAGVKHVVRKTPDGREFYFLSSRDAANVEILFRSAGKRPFLWHPDTGDISPLPVYLREDGRTRIPLHFPPNGSFFVVFDPEDHGAPDGYSKIERDGVVLFPSDGREMIPLEFTADGKMWRIASREKGAYSLTGADGKSTTFDSAAPRSLDIAGPWQVAFEKDRGAPDSATFDELKSWTASSDPGIKFFSGYASYKKEFDLPPTLDPRHSTLLLDLGQVGDVAHVKVNGKDFGTLWKPPFRVDVTDAVKTGKNELEIAVVNTWLNRVLGDDLSPKDKPVANTGTHKPIPASELDKYPSGLLGPVTLESLSIFQSPEPSTQTSRHKQTK